MLLISFQPFQPGGSGTAGGNIVNQLGYGSLGALSILSLAAYANPRVVSALLSPSMVLLLGFFMLSVVNAIDPAAALRAAFFTLDRHTRHGDGAGHSARRRCLLDGAGRRGAGDNRAQLAWAGAFSQRGDAHGPRAWSRSTPAFGAACSRTRTSPVR